MRKLTGHLQTAFCLRQLAIQLFDIWAILDHFAHFSLIWGNDEYAALQLAWERIQTLQIKFSSGKTQ